MSRPRNIVAGKSGNGLVHFEFSRLRDTGINPHPRKTITLYLLSLAGRCRGGLTSAGAPGVAAEFRWATLCNHRLADKRPLVHSDPIYGPDGRFGPRLRPVTAQVRQSIASGHCVAGVIRQWCQDGGTNFFGFPTEGIVRGTNELRFEAERIASIDLPGTEPTEFTRFERPIESLWPVIACRHAQLDPNWRAAMQATKSSRRA